MLASECSIWDGVKGQQVQADTGQCLVQEFDPELQIIMLCLVEAHIAVMVCGILCCSELAQEMACKWNNESCVIQMPNQFLQFLT